MKIQAPVYPGPLLTPFPLPLKTRSELRCQDFKRCSLPPSPSRYEARGLFLDPPTAGLSAGRWRLKMPDGPLPAVSPQDLEFASADELFSLSRCNRYTLIPDPWHVVRLRRRPLSPRQVPS